MSRAVAQKSKPKTSKKTASKKAVKKTFIDLLIEDHEKVKGLFKAFEETESHKQMKEIAGQILTELKIHTRIEEEIVYPAIRQLETEEVTEMMNEADEEHHAVKLLMHEIETYGSVDGHYQAKVTVLGELVEHHIEEEEMPGGMFTKARKLENKDNITERLVTLKKQLAHEYGLKADD